MTVPRLPFSLLLGRKVKKNPPRHVGKRGAFGYRKLLNYRREIAAHFAVLCVNGASGKQAFCSMLSG
jgi:cell division protein FtsB